jgi:hypothetical protein
VNGNFDIEDVGEEHSLVYREDICLTWRDRMDESHFNNKKTDSISADSGIQH